MKELLKLSKLLASMKKTSLSKRVENLYKISSLTYSIKPGDNLDKITKGDVRWQKLIREFNPGVDWNRLQIGQIINFPPQPIRPNASMTYSSELVDFIKREEGFNPVEYLDQNDNPTIGWGHKIKGNEEPAIGPYYVMDRSEANTILLLDLEEAAGYIKRNIDTGLNQHQFDAITSLIFNMGSGNLESTGIPRLLDQGKMSEVEGLIPTAFATGVEDRRQREAKLFASGIY